MMMDGAFKIPGNVNPGAVFKVWADPGVAAIVFHSGIPITAVARHLPQTLLMPVPQTLLLLEKNRTINGASPRPRCVAAPRCRGSTFGR